MKKLQWAIVGCLALIFVGSAGFVWAAGQGQAGQAAPAMKCQERFDAMDTNHDGKVTREEFMAVKHPGGRAEEVFKARDLNGDGVLTKEEFCSGKGMGKGRNQ